jgi:hypothetical protein
MIVVDFGRYLGKIHHDHGGTEIRLARKPDYGQVLLADTGTGDAWPGTLCSRPIWAKLS